MMHKYDSYGNMRLRRANARRNVRPKGGRIITMYESKYCTYRTNKFEMNLK